MQKWRSEERFLSTQADAFAGSESGGKSRPASFEMTGCGVLVRLFEVVGIFAGGTGRGGQLEFGHICGFELAI